MFECGWLCVVVGDVYDERWLVFYGVELVCCNVYVGSWLFD